MIPKRVRHVKRGSTYDVIGVAEAQVSKTGRSDFPATARLIGDGDRIVVYKADSDGKLWCRFEDEFLDGRFEVVEPAGTPSMPANVSALVERLNDGVQYVRDTDGSWVPFVSQADLFMAEAASALQALVAEIALKDRTIEGLQENLQSAEEDAAGYANEAERIERIYSEHSEHWGRRINTAEAKLREVEAEFAAFKAAEDIEWMRSATIDRLQDAEAKLREAVSILVDFNDAAEISPTMEGPRFKEWNRSKLDRARERNSDFLASQENER